MDAVTRWFMDLDAALFRILLLGGVLILLATASAYLLAPDLRATWELSQSHPRAPTPAAMDALRRRLSAAQARQEGLRRALGSVTREMPGEPMEAGVLDTIQKITWQEGLQLVGAHPESPQHRGALVTEAFGVDLRGDYEALHRWFRRLAQRAPFIFPQRADITREGDSHPGSELAIRLRLIAYRRAKEEN